nr:proline-rich receptor-like protein kinase PERK2 [Peromyscus maniculatus bairdii]
MERVVFLSFSLERETQPSHPQAHSSPSASMLAPRMCHRAGRQGVQATPPRPILSRPPEPPKPPGALSSHSGQAAGKQEPPDATNPARPRRQSQGGPFPSAPGRTTQRPSLPGSRGPVALPLGLLGLCLRSIECGPLPHPNPVSQDTESSLQSEHVRRPEFLHPVRPPLTQRHLRRGSLCGRAPTPACLLPRRDRPLAPQPSRGSGLRAPGSRLPAPARPDLEEWGGAAEAAPPPPREGSGLPRTLEQPTQYHPKSSPTQYPAPK